MAPPITIILAVFSGPSCCLRVLKDHDLQHSNFAFKDPHFTAITVVVFQGGLAPNCAFVCREKAKVYLWWAPKIWTVIDYFSGRGTANLLRLIENPEFPNYLTVVCSRTETCQLQTPSAYTSVITSWRVC